MSGRAPEVVPLRYVADIRSSNVDKKSADGEMPVRLVNYTDVYYQSAIHPELELMEATATAEQVARFGLRDGDSIITKDSETPEDIAVPTYVQSASPEMVCGYHLAIIRPGTSMNPKFLYWALGSEFMRGQFSSRANGMTRYGLSLDGIRGTEVPVLPVEEQRRIADFLDDQVARIDQLVPAREEQRVTLKARYAALIAREFEGGESRPLKVWLRESPAYGVLVPRFVDVGVPMIRISDLDHLDDPSYSVATIEPAQSAEYSRTVTEPGDLLVSCVGSMGKAALVNPERAGSNMNRPLARLRPQSPEIGEALLYWVSTQDFANQALLATGTGAAQPTLNMSDLKNFSIRMPDVVTALPRMRAIDQDRRSALHAFDKNLALLEERKRALITAAVTGELDVTTAKPIGMGKWVPNVGASVEAPAAAQSSGIGGIG